MMNITPTFMDALATLYITKNDSDDEHEVEEEPHREPFFAFIPRVAKYAARIVSADVTLALEAVAASPFFLKDFLLGTYTYYRSHLRTLYKELMSGFIVGITLVPESIAFSFILNIPPTAGLQTCFWMAVITGTLSGKPGMISSIAGAMAVVAAPLTADNGVLEHFTSEQRFAVYQMSVLACGAMQLLFAILRLSTFTRLISESCIIGFMNGLAVVIFIAQLPAFQYCDADPVFIDCTSQQRKYLTFQSNPAELILLLVHLGLSMLIVYFFPRILPRVGKYIPSSLVAILIGILIEQTLFRMAIGVSTRTVRETAPVNGSLPSFSWPSVPANSNLAGTILKYGLMMATVGSIESVLTLRVCNDITGDVTELRDSSQELAAQGLGNLMNSMFGATGGSVLIGQAKINIMNGARHRVSSVFAGICVLVFSVALTSFINLIPIGTLTGILFVIVLSTFQMKSFLIFRYGRLSDSASILIVTLLGVFYNLAIGIAAGVTLSAIVHAWDSGSDIDADIVCKPMTVQGEERYVKYVHVRGVLFFSSTAKFINLFSISNDPSTVILDFKDAFISDHSAVVAIQNLSDRFDQAGKSVLITNLAGKSHGRLHRTGNHAELKKQIIKSSLIQEKACDEESLQSHQASD